ncbi:MAG: CDP-diacylglycerol--glycerol-3-phosphate 3-phosphatidyltransferase [Alphaproteobacteria bacterium]|jgi:cardiolipin synthase|nr:CDP-diacylglycerol--glycerol-3-phosphate 3-phosphatidyltransferase [Alphaproteobacteria bacterium]MDP6564969.1 CDP-diacylglycerol--glycerol-3-phosphate 3-phosphatidyltransferase [Alphaproteobacteria bacterium]MDP6811807.1 CDP-diacylglycerol--glycerol-3-phosphate 3-phosphatidyltransferase [Alphaproteobacteria bacterium]
MITTLPNLLTLSRILAIPALIGAFYLASPLSNWLAFGIFVAAGITDILDGHLARSRDEVTGLGRFLDPVADKLLVAATLLMLVHVDRIGDWTIMPTVVILCREIMVSGLREFLAELRVGVPVSRLAKWKTGVQMTAIGFVVIGDAGWEPIPVVEIGIAGLWLAALLTIYTGYDYLRAGLKHMTGADAPASKG